MCVEAKKTFWKNSHGYGSEGACGEGLADLLEISSSPAGDGGYGGDRTSESLRGRIHDAGHFQRTVH